MTGELTGVALNRAIADKLRITCKFVHLELDEDNRLVDVEEGDLDSWEFRDSNGHYLTSVKFYNDLPIKSEDIAWLAAWVKDFDSVSTPLPDWTNDASAALALCLEFIPAAWVCVQRWGANRERYCATVLITGAGDKAERPLVEGVIADTEAQALALLALKALGAV